VLLLNDRGNLLVNVVELGLSIYVHLGLHPFNFVIEVRHDLLLERRKFLVDLRACVPNLSFLFNFVQLNLLNRFLSFCKLVIKHSRLGGEYLVQLHFELP